MKAPASKGDRRLLETGFYWRIYGRYTDCKALLLYSLFTVRTKEWVIEEGQAFKKGLEEKEYKNMKNTLVREK